MNESQFKEIHDTNKFFGRNAEEDKRFNKAMLIKNIKEPEEENQARAEATASTNRSKNHIKELRYCIENAEKKGLGVKGQLVPITVEECDDGFFQLVCRHHTLQAMASMERDTVWAYVAEFKDDVERKKWKARENLEQLSETRLNTTEEDFDKSVHDLVVESFAYGDHNDFSHQDGEQVNILADSLVEDLKCTKQKALHSVRRVLKAEYERRSSDPTLPKADSKSKNKVAKRLKDYEREYAWVYARERLRGEDGSLIFGKEAAVSDVYKNTTVYVVNKKQDVKNHLANVMWKKIRTGFKGECIAIIYLHITYKHDWASLDKWREEIMDQIEALNGTDLINTPIFDDIYFLPQKVCEGEHNEKESLKDLLKWEDLRPQPKETLEKAT